MILLISTSILVFGISCSNQDLHKLQFERIVKLEGQPNFRDLGAYQTTDGISIKTGLLYRSGTLSRLTESDMEKLKSLKINTIVNFLTEEERNKNGEDKLPQGVKSFYLPISGQNNEAVAILHARQNGDFSKVPADFNFNIHGMLVEDGKEEYAQLFRILSDENNYPIVFHCSHGIHRTGTAASLLLSILGVSWDTVREDYLLSNKYRQEEIEQRVNALKQLASENPAVTNKELNKKNIEAFYILNGEYIDGTKKTIEEDYGSFEKYLESIGVQKEKINDINQILIERSLSYGILKKMKSRVGESLCEL